MCCTSIGEGDCGAGFWAAACHAVRAATCHAFPKGFSPRTAVHVPGRLAPALSCSGRGGVVGRSPSKLPTRPLPLGCPPMAILFPAADQPVARAGHTPGAQAGGHTTGRKGGGCGGGGDESRRMCACVRTLVYMCAFACVWEGGALCAYQRADGGKRGVAAVRWVAAQEARWGVAVLLASDRALMPCWPHAPWVTKPARATFTACAALPDSPFPALPHSQPPPPPPPHLSPRAEPRYPAPCPAAHTQYLHVA